MDRDLRLKLQLRKGRPRHEGEGPGVELRRDCLIPFHQPLPLAVTLPSQAPHKSSYLSNVLLSGEAQLRGPDAYIDSFAATAFFSNITVQEAYHVKVSHSLPESRVSIRSEGEWKGFSRRGRERTTSLLIPAVSYVPLLRTVSVSLGQPPNGTDSTWTFGVCSTAPGWAYKVRWPSGVSSAEDSPCSEPSRLLR